MPDPLLTRHRLNGFEQAVWEWPGEGPPILLCHATSFHARCWDQVVSSLPGRRVLALDFRGHGASQKPQPPVQWRPMGEDVAELSRALGIRGALAAGHSMGGHALALAAALAPGAFSSLLLLDPVILPEEAYRGAHTPLEFVLKRRDDWNSPQEMFERFRSRPPFDRWDEKTLRDYCDYGLNGKRLACPPAVEASIYANSSAADANIYPMLSTIEIPVHVVRSRDPYQYGSFSGSPTNPHLARHFQNGRDTKLDGLSHFIPMEDPALTAELILSL